MKELSIEEKATAYDNVRKKIATRFGSNVAKEIFSEYEESEDERIRKVIIATIHLYYGEPLEDEAKEMIAWLEKQGKHANFRNKIQIGDKVTRNEDGVLVNLSQLKRVAKKQGEQKPADKVESKFHEGEWVVSPNGVYWHIDKISNSRYEVTSNTGGSSNWPLDTNIYHRFTVQDAKDGDVLAWDNSKCIALFKNIYDEDSFNSYGFIGHCTGAFEARKSYHDIKGAHPATKEQYDLLFKKMEEAGYMWDSKNKELQKMEQKSAWSEENETVLDNLIYALANDRIGNNRDEYVDFLKSLKKRYTWKPSDELEEASYQVGIKRVLENPESYGLTKYNWKPSDEQIKMLDKIIGVLDRAQLFGGKNALIDLKHDLKRLREE